MHELFDKQHVRDGSDDLGDAIQKKQILPLVFQNGEIAAGPVLVMDHVVTSPLHSYG
jgi:hypothetical protein